MERAPNVQKFVDILAKQIYGRTILDAKTQNICLKCGKQVGKFKDDISVREFGITGICQRCQDNIFGEDE